ncbi:MAG: glycoside hydrolase family 2 TIM barrel-domain containing protein [Rikenellaceae bacterium]
MKNILLSLLFSVLSLSAMAREVINFNYGWNFTTNFNEINKGEIVSLPHIWQKNGNINIQNQNTAYYIKEFKAPVRFNSKDLYLRFHGVSSVAAVYINGKFAYEHKGAYTAFNVNVTPFINSGAYNSIMVVVSNSQRLDVMPFLSENKIFGGIYSDVELIVTEKEHISLDYYGSEGVFVKTKNLTDSAAEIEATVMLNGTPSSLVGVEVEISSDDVVSTSNFRNIKLDSRGEAKAIMSLNLDYPRLWRGKSDPFLYDISVKTIVSNIATDSVTTKFGVRKVEIDASNQFLLNGDTIMLRGVNMVQDNDLSASAYSNQDFIIDTDLILEMGANSVRSNSSALSSYAYDLFDKEGIIAWIDLPFASDMAFEGKGFADNYALRDNGERQLMELVYQHYNHPSICFLGIFNEISTTGDSPISYISELNTIAKREWADRITVASSVGDGAINKITDAITWPIYYGWNQGIVTDFSVWVNQIKSNYRELKGAIAEYGIPADFRTKPSKENENLGVIRKESNIYGYPQNSQSLFHESYYKVIRNSSNFWGSYISSMFEYSSNDSSTGGINQMGLVSYDRTRKKDAFYFYKANWNKNDMFIHIANKIYNNRVGLKQNLKVYTNLQDATLFVNGVEIGTKSASLGTIEWSNVALNRGSNRIAVRSSGYSDSFVIQIYDDLMACNL